MGSVQIWSTIHQQLRVPDLPPDAPFTDWASCPSPIRDDETRRIDGSVHGVLIKLFSLGVMAEALQAKIS